MLVARRSAGVAGLVTRLALAALVTAACGSDQALPGPGTSVPGAGTSVPGAGTSVPGAGNPVPGAGQPAPLNQVGIAVEEVTRLTAPLAMAVRPGDDRLYVAEKGGRVRTVGRDSGGVATVLDISGEVSGGSEQGLLGLAFSPSGDHLYVNYTDRSGDTRVVEYPFDDAGADPAGARTLLVIDQPFANHNGGHLVTGPDANLWITTGDGGGAGDPEDNGQDVTTLLGKVLRLDPTPDRDAPYTVPADNPFDQDRPAFDQDGARPEIWAFGLRNPWRLSFDRDTADLWIADVGQSTREEINLAPADQGWAPGANYGWNRLEGTAPFEGSAPAGAVPPVFEYDRDGGNCSVTGGYVYRGQDIPGLVGTYVFADFCAGELRGLRVQDGSVQEQGLGVTVARIASFGEDSEGELYVLSLDGGVFRLVAS